MDFENVFLFYVQLVSILVNTFIRLHILNYVIILLFDQNVIWTETLGYFSQ